MESITIREIMSQLERGQIRIPSFQRGFVWDFDRIAYFIDSIYKGYPFGSLLFWRAKELLDHDRYLGPFELPEPQEDYPIDYVLDGQQRVTSIYVTFQNNTNLADIEDWKDIYFDFSIPDTIQEPQFFALDSRLVDTNKHFPMKFLFDTIKYRQATSNFSNETAKKIDEMQAKFKEARIPIQMFKTENKSTVAVIFERINRQGVPLDTLQLLSAWTWSEDFHLQNQFSELIEELESKGFQTSSSDENLLLRCASAILVGDPRPEAIIEISGREVRARFDEVWSGILGAWDFLSSNLNIRKLENLPFQTILVPLSVFFAISQNRQIVVSQQQRDKILKWFWRACFSKRYSSGVIRYLEEDITAMLQLKGGQASSLGNFNTQVSDDFFLTNSFGMRSVNTKTFVLLLASQGPLSFVSGSPINLDDKLKQYNKTEFHHLMPRAFVNLHNNNNYSVDCLANFCFLSRSENQHLGGVKPSQYRNKMSKDVKRILSKAVCPASLFKDDFDSFVLERASLLRQVAEKLIR